MNEEMNVLNKCKSSVALTDTDLCLTDIINANLCLARINTNNIWISISETISEKVTLFVA